LLLLTLSILASQVKKLRRQAHVELADSFNVTVAASTKTLPAALVTLDTRKFISEGGVI
jgi:hypothetical protein